RSRRQSLQDSSFPGRSGRSLGTSLFVLAIAEKCLYFPSNSQPEPALDMMLPSAHWKDIWNIGANVARVGMATKLRFDGTLKYFWGLTIQIAERMTVSAHRLNHGGNSFSETTWETP
ncbi:MAG: hypothetical protein ABL921_19005, partial [Pirellula sp.]